MLSSLKDNLLLKIISIIIAVIIWYVVVGYNDPVETSSYNVRVQVTNESYIENGKQSYRIDDVYKNVVVYVRGNRSKLRDLRAEDIQVTADLTEIVDLSLDPIMVPLSVNCPGFTRAELTLSRQTIPLVIEVIANKTFPVTVNIGDSQPGSNFEVGTLTPNPETLGINGPESLINNIDSVVAEIDVSGMTLDGTKKATIKIYDKSGSEISQETIDDDLSFDGDVSEITVAVDLWRKRSNIAFKANYSGKPADGFHVLGITTTPETVTVVGTDDALEKLKDNGDIIEIPAELVPVEGAKEDLAISLDIAEFLPEGLRLSQNTAGTMTVNLTVLSDESREIKIDVDDVATDNLANDLTLSYDQAEVTVRVEGPGNIINALKPADIKASLDLAGLAEGEHSLKMNFELPSDVSLQEEVTVKVRLKEKA